MLCYAMLCYAMLCYAGTWKISRRESTDAPPERGDASFHAADLSALAALGSRKLKSSDRAGEPGDGDDESSGSETEVMKEASANARAQSGSAAEVDLAPMKQRGRSRLRQLSAPYRPPELLDKAAQARSLAP